MTIGAERPPYGARHRKFWPFSSQRPTSPVSGDVPSRFGPRTSGQSPAATLRGPCAEPPTAAATRMTTTIRSFLDITKSPNHQSPDATIQKLIPALIPNVLGAPFSPTNPDGASPG